MVKDLGRHPPGTAGCGLKVLVQLYFIIAEEVARASKAATQLAVKLNAGQPLHCPPEKTIFTIQKIKRSYPSRWNTAMCLTGHFCLMSLQIFLISFSAIGTYASYSKLMTFLPSKLFLVVPKKQNKQTKSHNENKIFPITEILHLHNSFKK